MKRILHIPVPAIHLLILVCSIVSAAASQTEKFQQRFIGTWWGTVSGSSIPPSRGNIWLIFARDDGGFRVSLFQNKKEFPADNIKLSADGFSFSISENPDFADFAGKISPDGKTLLGKTFQKASRDPKTSGNLYLRYYKICPAAELSLVYEEAKKLTRAGNYDARNLKLTSCDNWAGSEDKLWLLGAIENSQKAFSFLKAKDYRNTYTHYNLSNGFLGKILTQDGSVTEALELRAGNYWQMAHFRLTVLADENFNKIDHYLIGGDIIPPKNELGADRQAIGWIDKCIEDLTILIYHSQFEVKGYVLRARAYYAKWSKFSPDTELLKSAIKDYKTAIDLNPLSADLYLERSRIYTFLGDTAHAEEDEKRALELRNSN